MATVDIPKKHKALVYDKPGSISTKIEELDVPEPGPGEVLINLTHSGVCHSDMGVMLNAWSMLPFPTQAGQVGGHEGVGRIVKMGPATDGAAVKVGDRVGIKWMSGICEACEPCRAGMDANCFNGVSLPLSNHTTPQQVLTLRPRKSQDTTPPAHSSSTRSAQPTT
jgi:propanol-preferring alcohol dehydrogenase